MKSVKQLTWNYLAVIILVSLAGFAGVIISAIHLVESESQAQQTHQHTLITQNYSDLIEFYKTIARNLAETQEVKDILLLEDTIARSSIPSPLISAISKPIGPS